MKKGKMLLLAGAACLACGGCGKDSAVQIVAPRETEQVDVITVENAAENSVREQVSAPEHVENEQVGAGVTLNADVEVPEVSGIQMKKVQWRDITNEDLELYQEVLFEGEPLCVSTDLYSMGLLTKEDIAQQIEELWKKYEGSLDEDEILQEIQDLDALYETAPDTLETEEVLLEIGPWQDEFWEDDGVEKTQAEVAVEQQNSYVGGYVKTARRTYYFNAANGSDFASVYLTDPTAQYWSEEWMRAQYGEGFEDEIVSGDGSLEQAKAQADALLSKLGLGDFAFFSESFEHFSNVSEGDTEMPYTRCYGMNYTRMVDGVPVSYAGDSVITSVGDSRQNE
ncbi:MAG: DUF6034 family protein, partial [Eubacteriales bacterium]|nr:DUF6034 family protein [Eubacteriales bacterium]